MRAMIVLAVATFASTPTLAEEKEIELIQAPGVETVEANCNSCHSKDYIEMNSHFLTPEKWDAEVNKMIRAFGASIGENEAKAIADYLKKNYGNNP